MKPHKIWSTKARFSGAATALRSEFESIFSDARKTDPRRFRFEPWSVPDQYYQLRTPAYEFFDSKSYLRFHHQLVDYGRTVLGCHDVSPPWLSLYLDGHFQEMHRDAPHGPWAFVYSLTPDSFFRLGSGGRTEIFNSEALAFGASAESFLEKDHVFHSIAPRFNQLTIFDGRFPHRVSPVRNVFEPKQGRLVIHGWFLNPRPFVDGPVSVNELSRHLDAFEKWSGREGLSSASPGVFNFRLQVNARGKTVRVESLASTLYGQDYDRVKKAVRQFWPSVTWQGRARASSIVVPLTWDAGGI